MLSADYGREARMMWKLAVAELVSSGGIVVSGQPQHAAPSLSLAATQRPAIEFATALLRASIPCGVEVREADDLPVSAGVATGESVSLGVALAAFAKSHPDYHAAITGGVVVIRPTTGALEFLNQASAIRSPMQVTGVMQAVRRVIYTQLNPAGLNWVTLNSMGRPGWDTPILLEGGPGRTVLEALNGVVLKVPGYAWVLWTRTEGGASRLATMGVLERNGDRQLMKYSPPAAPTRK
jgi:hypothetical protein